MKLDPGAVEETGPLLAASPLTTLSRNEKSDRIETPSLAPVLRIMFPTRSNSDCCMRGSDAAADTANLDDNDEASDLMSVVSGML